MQDEINQLTNRINQLEKFILGTHGANNFEELIRDIVFFDNDSGSLSSTTVVTGVDFAGQTVSTASVQTGSPAKFLKLYYRGQVYHIPVYSLT